MPYMPYRHVIAFKARQRNISACNVCDTHAASGPSEMNSVATRARYHYYYHLVGWNRGVSSGLNCFVFLFVHIEHIAWHTQKRMCQAHIIGDAYQHTNTRAYFPQGVWKLTGAHDCIGSRECHRTSVPVERRAERSSRAARWRARAPI